MNMEDRKATIEPITKRREILLKLEGKTGYHHPLSERMQEDLSRLKQKKDESGKLE